MKLKREALQRLLDALQAIQLSRSQIMHVYEGVDHVIPWDAIENQLPSLKARLQSALEQNQT